MEDTLAVEVIHASDCSSIAGSIADFLASPYCQAKSVLVLPDFVLEIIHSRVIKHENMSSLLMRSIQDGDAHPNQFISQAEKILSLIGGHDEDCKLFIPGDFLKAEEIEKPPGTWSIMRDLCATPTCRSLVLSALVLSQYHLSELCNGLASSNCTLHSLHMSDIQIIRSSIAEAARMELSEALLKNASLQSLSIQIAHENSSTALLMAGLIQEILTHLALNTMSLSRLMLRGFNRLDRAEEVGKMIQTNTSLTHLGISSFFLEHKDLLHLFTSLEKNFHLTSLSLSDCVSPSWSSTIVLDSLQAHGILSELDLTGTPLERNAAISAQLARNHENKTRMEVLKSQGMSQVPPKGVRLFLCGLPYAGKTTLSRSLARHLRGSKRSNCFLCVKSTLLERTRGIDVSVLEKDGMKVALWDLAGQTEYHSFHDHMFPNLSNRASPSFFLFVWNPIEVDANGHDKEIEHGRIKFKLVEKFREEFNYWLKFIASKTLRSHTCMPKLIIVITRADRHPQNTKSWFETTFKELQQSFEEIIQFDLDGVFEIDAREPTQVVELASYVFKCARKILASVPHVYHACDNTRSMLASLLQTKGIAPLITKDEFYILCHRRLGIDSREVQEAIALSLNDSGDLIYLASSSLQFVVVDIQWFCHQVMGDLLYHSVRSHDRNPNGFFSLKYLEKILEDQFNAMAHDNRGLMQQINRRAPKAPKIEGKVLVKLLVGLQLACLQDSNQEDPQIFIPPTSISGTSNSKCNPIFQHKSDMDIYLGRRLKCRDSKCTFLTPGVFPLLQVTLHGIFKDREVHVMLEQDVIAFTCDGVGVSIEFCRHGREDHFIDVLIRSPKNLDDTLEWVQENVMDNIERVCVQPRGIQGVELAHEVIRPACVEQGLSIEERTEAVSVEQLKDILEKHVQKKGFGLNGFKEVLYTWQPTGDSDQVTDLLGMVETLRVLECYQRGLSVAVEDALGIAEDEIRREPEKPVFGTTVSAKERKVIYDKLCAVEKRLIEEMQKIGKRIEELRHAVLPKLQERMNELLTFAKEGEAGRLPRMFVLTQDHDRLVRRIVASMVPGLQNVRLELLCEHHRKPHPVVGGGKAGLSFAALDDGLLKRGLPYINAFLKLANVAVKVGAHVAAGIGGDTIIPDFTHVLSLIEDTSEIPGLPTFREPVDPAPSTSSASRLKFQEGQQWLFDLLSTHNCHTSTQIYKIFGLRRVRYPHNSKVAWLCDEHYSDGEPWPA